MPNTIVREPIRTAAHLVVLAVPFCTDGEQLMMEAQATIGVAMWCENFGSLIVAAPTLPREQAETAPGFVAKPVDHLRDRVQFVPLPWAYEVKPFVRHCASIVGVLSECIDRSTYLQFQIGALVGDWAGVGAELSIRKHRKYAVHMDRVEDRVLLTVNQTGPWLRRAKARVVSPMMRRWHHRLIGRAHLALCHGHDTYSEYAPLTPFGRLVHDVHVERDADRTRRLSLQKQAELRSGAALRVCYAGRAVTDKAPLDWVQAVARAIAAGAPIQATWLGDGELRPRAIELARQLGISQHVSFPGFVADRSSVMQEIENSHVMLFAHLVPESPRCLLESLMHATPIVGYQTPYPADLVARHGGGRLVPMRDVEALGGALVALHRDREAAADLVGRAERDGERFGMRAVFRERSELIQQHLS